MPDIVNVLYNQTGQSTKINPMGMRDMQARAFDARDAQYLLLKSPPASGKSRALMFLALDEKLVNKKKEEAENLAGELLSAALGILQYNKFIDYRTLSRCRKTVLNLIPDKLKKG